MMPTAVNKEIKFIDSLWSIRVKLTSKTFNRHKICINFPLKYPGYFMTMFFLPSISKVILFDNIVYTVK
jgi:hypothetical protein